MARTEPCTARRLGWKGKADRCTAEAHRGRRHWGHHHYLRYYRTPGRARSPGRAPRPALGAAPSAWMHRRRGKPARRALGDVDIPRRPPGPPSSLLQPKHAPSTTSPPVRHERPFEPRSSCVAPPGAAVRGGPSAGSLGGCMPKPPAIGPALDSSLQSSAEVDALGGRRKRGSGALGKRTP